MRIKDTAGVATIRHFICLGIKAKRRPPTRRALLELSYFGKYYRSYSSIVVRHLVICVSIASSRSK